jgi:hypothetical protein
MFVAFFVHFDISFGEHLFFWSDNGSSVVQLYLKLFSQKFFYFGYPLE